MHTNPFATEAARYVHLRPTYPEDLFAFLSTTVASREAAWDCATGNGQASVRRGYSVVSLPSRCLKFCRAAARNGARRSPSP
jgi:hypothetical protein